MQTLKQQIHAAWQDVTDAESTLSQARARYRELLNQQADCVHDFAAPLRGWEHEGGVCKLCGVNELYAITLQQRKKS